MRRTYSHRLVLLACISPLRSCLKHRESTGDSLAGHRNPCAFVGSLMTLNLNNAPSKK